ncbi:MAG: carboxypeptidase-like regulatory domain-containing protein [Ignavibacteria bacterium]
MLSLRENTFKIFLIIALLWLSGCDDNPINNENKITGIIYDFKDLPVPGVTVNVQNRQPYYLTQADGKFTFENISAPYDIKIEDIYLFKNLNAQNINLKTIFSSPIHYKLIYLKIPDILKSSQAGVFKFLSNDPNYSVYKRIYAPDTESDIVIEYPLNAASIQGKIIFLSYTFDQNGLIKSYEHYGEKKLTLSNNLIDTVTFIESELGFDPPECEISLNVENNAPGFSNSIFSIRFNDYHYEPIMSLMDVSTDKNNNVIKFIQPSILNYPFDIEIQTSQNSGKGSGNQNLMHLNDCSNGSVIFSDPMTLEYPQNKQSGINRETNLIYDLGSSDGVYEITLQDLSNFYIKIYTDEKSVNVGDLIDNGFGIYSYVQVLWRVVKFSGYNSINEFVDEPAGGKKIDMEIKHSEVRIFYTGDLK